MVTTKAYLQLRLVPDLQLMRTFLRITWATYVLKFLVNILFPP